LPSVLGPWGLREGPRSPSNILLLFFQVINERLNLKSLGARWNPLIDLSLCHIALLKDVLNRLNLQLTLFLIVLVSELLPLLREALLGE